MKAKQKRREEIERQAEAQGRTGDNAMRVRFHLDLVPLLLGGELYC